MFQQKHGAVYESTSSTETTIAAQTTLDGIFNITKKYSIQDRRQQQLTDALVLFVTCDLIPFSVVDSPYFQG